MAKRTARGRKVLPGLTYDEMAAKIVAAIKLLPVLDPVMRDVLAPGAARGIIIKFDPKTKKYRLSPQNSPDVTPVVREICNKTTLGNNRLPASRVATDRDLAKLKKCAIALAVALDNAHSPAIERIWLTPDGIQKLRNSVWCVALSAEGADTSAISTDTGRGAPPDIGAASIALLVAERYAFFTGRLPTPGFDRINKTPNSDFSKFLKDIFCALGITASLEHHARKACAGLSDDYRDKCPKKS